MGIYCVGRIGRLVFRTANANPEVEVEAVLGISCHPLAFPGLSVRSSWRIQSPVPWFGIVQEHSPALTQLAPRISNALRFGSTSSDPFAKVKGLMRTCL